MPDRSLVVNRRAFLGGAALAATGLLLEATGQGAEAAAERPAAEAPELELAPDLGPAGADPEFPDDLL